MARDPEAIVRRDHVAVIEAARAAPRAANGRLGRPLRLLLAGYVGASNTGADTRTGEFARQLRSVLGGEGLELGVLAMRPNLPQRLGGLHVEIMDRYPPEFVRETCGRYDGVLACEGSLFTSSFSDDLTALLSAFLGYAAAQGKLALAVGAETDEMSEEIASFVRQQCRGAVIFARNEASRRRLQDLGLNAHYGTDTAWTFMPRPARSVHELLRKLGWDGHRDVLAICPGNPFWWPVKLDPRRALRMRGEDPNYYGNYAFHRSSDDIERRFGRYLDALAAAVDAHQRAFGVFPVVIGMERLDRDACLGLARRLHVGPPLMAGECDADTIVAVLRASERLISTRLHALILSMSAGVPAVGVAFDGRIPALLGEAGLAELVLDTHDQALEERLIERLHYLAEEGERIARHLRSVAGLHLRRQGEMGLAVRCEVARRHSDLPLPEVAPGWRGGLPPLAPELAELTERPAGNICQLQSFAKETTQ